MAVEEGSGSPRFCATLARLEEQRWFCCPASRASGKSRPVRELGEGLEGEPHLRLLYQCSPHHTTSPLHPVIEQLKRAGGFERDDSQSDRLEKLEALLAQGTQKLNRVVPLVAALLSIPANDRYPLPELTPQRQKELTLEALGDQLGGLSATQPVIVTSRTPTGSTRLHWSCSGLRSTASIA